MTSATGIAFFLVFGIVQVAMYIVVRRRLLPPFPVALIGVILSIIMIFLMAREAGNNIYQAGFAGIIVGGLLSAATLGMAIYFLNSERRVSGGDVPVEGDEKYMPPDQQGEDDS